MSKPKAKIYIDGANMFYTQQKLGFSIDWQKMQNYLKERWDVLEMRYYVGPAFHPQVRHTVLVNWLDN